MKIKKCCREEGSVSSLLTTIVCLIFVANLVIDDQSTKIFCSGAILPVNNSRTYGNAFNRDNPFIYPVPFPIFLLLQSPYFNRTHDTFNEPYFNQTREEIGGYFYHRDPECGVHFINEREGLIINHHVTENETETERCTWAFVGNRFCTPSVHCPTFKRVGKEGDCRKSYLQITDAGETFTSHYCDNMTTPLNQEITANGGVLDITFRFTDDNPSSLHFECLVKCVQYKVNYTKEGTNVSWSSSSSSSSLPNKIGNSLKKEEETKGDKKILTTIKSEHLKSSQEGGGGVAKSERRKEINFPPPQLTNKCQCGIPNGYKYRIVGGREAGVSQYPWVVGILNENKKLPFCGSSLINDRYVLTAAHCMEDESVDDLVVVLNEHDFENDTETIGRTIKRRVAEIIPYHYYLDSTFNADVALLRLDEPVDITNFTTTPICLPRNESKMYEGSDVIGAGWGTLMEDGKKSAKLQEVIMRVFSNAACNDYHSSDPQFPPQVTETMLCAGFPEGGRDTCAGDSGGPLITWENKRFTQVGITSWGFGCGNRYNPGVFTRTTAFTYWINANTQDAVWCANSFN